MPILNYISWSIGKLAGLSRPQPLARLAVKIFAKLVKIDLTEASAPLSSYTSVAELFTRDLRLDARPIGRGLVSPVDGTMRAAQRIVNGRLEQIKNRDYQLSSLLANNELAQSFADATYFNLYLAPHNYHHVHAPCDCTVNRITYIPGRLLPVNNWSVQRVDGLFTQNERLILELNSEFGPILLVMVGATNVGKMSLTCASIITNDPPWKSGRTVSVTNLSSPVTFSAGMRLGTFHLGSTVVLIVADGAKRLELVRKAPSIVRFGEALAKI